MCKSSFSLFLSSQDRGGGSCGGFLLPGVLAPGPRLGPRGRASFTCNDYPALVLCMLCMCVLCVCVCVCVLCYVEKWCGWVECGMGCRNGERKRKGPTKIVRRRFIFRGGRRDNGREQRGRRRQRGGEGLREQSGRIDCERRVTRPNRVTHRKLQLGNVASLQKQKKNTNELSFSPRCIFGVVLCSCCIECVAVK